MNLSNSPIDKRIDITGKVCPYTVMEARKALKTMEVGQILEITIDYKPAAQESIPNFCRKNNYPIDVTDKGDGTYRILIKKEES